MVQNSAEEVEFLEIEQYPYTHKENFLGISGN